MADWSEPLPRGYTWPAFSDLPEPGSSQIAEAQNAGGIYRCILVDAASAAVANGDTTSAAEYAARADEYATPGSPSTLAVTENGAAAPGPLSIASQICVGISGALSAQ